MPSILQSTATSNSKESSATSRTWSLCQDGGLTFRKRSIRVISANMLMKSRYVVATHAKRYPLSEHLNRLILVNHNTMPLFAQVPARRLVMPSRVPLW
jgi:hypothetical protein